MAMSTTKSDVAVHNQPLNCQTGICTNIAQQRKIFNPNIAIWNLEILSVDGSWQTKVQRSPLQITVLSYQTPVGTYWPHQAGDASDKQTKEPQFHKYKHKYKYTNTPRGSYWPHQMPQLIDFHWCGMKHLDTYILLTGWMNPDQPARLGRQLAIWHPVDQQPSDHLHMSLTLSLSLTGIILYPCNALCWIHVLRRHSLSVDNSHLDQAAAPNWPRPRLRNSSQLSLLMQHWTWDYLEVQCYNIGLEITYKSNVTTLNLRLLTPPCRICEL